jgi:hypothetical protein
MNEDEERKGGENVLLGVGTEDAVERRPHHPEEEGAGVREDVAAVARAVVGMAVGLLAGEPPAGSEAEVAAERVDEHAATWWSQGKEGAKAVSYLFRNIL